VFGALAGGRLGAAAFDPVEIPFGALAVVLLLATLLGGGAATLLPCRGNDETPEDLPDTDLESGPADPGPSDAAPSELHSSVAPVGADSSAVELGNSGAGGD
jgi:hypothetical protein